MGTAFPSRRRNRASRQRDERPCGDAGASGKRTPRLERWRGDLWTTPREETRFAAGSQGPERVGKVGAKVRRVARTWALRSCMRTDRRSSRATARRRAGRSRRAAVNGQGAATSIGNLPPAGGTSRCGEWRGPFAGAHNPSLTGRPFLENGREWHDIVQRGIAHAAHPTAPRRVRRGRSGRTARP
jgi:hypothetical protein